jgi:hypothetical protein
MDRDGLFARRDAVEDDRSAVPRQGRADLADLGRAGRLDHDVVARAAGSVERRLLRTGGIAAPDQDGPVDAQGPRPIELELRRCGDRDGRCAARLEQLREEEAGRPGTEDERARPGEDADALEAVGRARRGLGEHRGVDRQALGGEDQALGRDDVLGEEPREVAAVALEARAVDRPAGEAELAATAVHVRVHADLLADLDAGDAVTEGFHRADELMAGDQREPRHEVAVVDVQVRAADPDLDDLDPDLARPRIGHRDVPGLEAAGSVIDDRLHRHLTVGLRARAAGKSVRRGRNTDAVGLANPRLPQRRTC